MTTYNVKGKFDLNDEYGEAEQEFYLRSILDVLPDGATAEIAADHFVVNVPDLNSDYVDFWIMVDRASASNIYGTIEQVLNGSSEYRKIVVINGQAHELYPYELAVLTPPVSVGVRTPDEPEVEENPEAIEPLTEPEAIMAVAAAADQNATKVLYAGILLGRSEVEAYLQTQLTDYEFLLMGAPVNDAVRRLVEATLLSTLRDVHSHVQAYVKEHGE